MKIALILNSTPAVSETFLISKIRGLQKNGHEVTIFARHKKDFKLCKVIILSNINRIFLIQIIKMVFTFFTLFFSAPLGARKFLKLEKTDKVPIRKRLENLYLNSKIIKNDFDWIHFPFMTLTIRRENVAKSINAKMSVSFRGYDIFVYPLRNPKCYESAWPKIDKVHSISECLLKKAEQYGLDRNNKQYIIRPAVDTSLFSKKIENSEFWEFSDRVKFLTIARLHWIKGLEYVLEALAYLEPVKFMYTIIGEGVEYERLKLAIDQLNLNDSVKIIRHVPHDKINLFYQETDIYIQYSLEEGFCNAVLEAQAMGTLTIVSDALGLQENVKDQKTGWVVPKRDPFSLNKKIKEILLMEEKHLSKIRENSIYRVNKNFNLTKQEQKFHRFFNENIF